MTEGTASISPTPERYRHALAVRGDITPADKQVVDSRGDPGAPFCAPDSIEILKLRGTITDEMANAARDFRNDFEVAGMQRLHAAPMEPRSKGHNDFTPHQIDARTRLNEALNILGGLRSPAGSICWFVVGEGLTIQEWAKRQGWGGRPVNRIAASGILIGALGVLVSHYGYGGAR
jgi:hypothetical protein